MNAKTIMIIAVVLFGVWTCACTSSSKKKPMERQTQHTFISQGDSAHQVHYLLYLPEKYPKKRELYPLILFLHGAGERGTNLELVKMHGPPKLAENQDFPFIIVSPQCPLNQRWNVELLHELLENIMVQYQVDPHRIYLTGLSMGGYGTWALAAAHPDKFAAIAPICGWGDINRSEFGGYSGMELSWCERSGGTHPTIS